MPSRLGSLCGVLLLAGLAMLSPASSGKAAAEAAVRGVSASWSSGAYAGFGLASGQARFAFSGLAPRTFPDARGSVVSFVLGYAWQSGASAFVAGELLLSAGVLEATTACALRFLSCSSAFTDLISARVRVGQRFDRGSVFLTLGASAAKERFRVGIGRILVESSDRVAGITVGLGAEMVLSQNLTLRADLEHSHFRRGTHDVTFAVPFQAKAQVTLVRVMLVQRF